jgi:hypothetical protein
MPFKFKSEETRKKVSDTAKRTIAKRKEKTQETNSLIMEWNKSAKPNTCIVCGESNQHSLDKHHPEGKDKNPHFIVTICASCHRVFDKGGGKEELIERRKRLFKE